MRLRSLLLLLLAPAALAAPAGPSSSGNDATYRTPPPAIADLLTAPRLPRGAPNASPDGAWLAVSDLRSLIPISVLAEPVLKLAGLEVLPEMWASRNGLKNAAAGLTFYKVADGTQVRAKLPQDVQLGAVRWSNKGDRVAYAGTLRNNADLDFYVIDPAATPEPPKPLTENQGGGWGVYDWSPDDRTLLAEEGISINETHLWLVDVASGTKKPLTPRGQKVAYVPVGFSRDGKGCTLRPTKTASSSGWPAWTLRRVR